MKLTKIALATIIASSFGIANAAPVDQGSGMINFTGKLSMHLAHFLVMAQSM
ncbi:hypothetical protein AB6F55_02770 [Providencia hangzhouensis]